MNTTDPDNLEAATLALATVSDDLDAVAKGIASVALASRDLVVSNRLGGLVCQLRQISTRLDAVTQEVDNHSCG